MMMGRMAADCERQVVTVHNGQDLYAFVTLCFADAPPPIAKCFADIQDDLLSYHGISRKLMFRWRRQFPIGI